jgi:group I intron endonuclease
MKWKINNQQKIGIYKIVNVLNNRIYVGSAILLQRRYASHISCLNRNRHGNSYLQNDWNKCGSEAFEFHLLEAVEKAEDLLTKENHWLNVYFDNKHTCYNICPVAGNTTGVFHSQQTKEKMLSIARKKAAPWQILSPDNVLYTVNGVRSFCKEHGLDRGALIRIKFKKSMSHKGWRLPENKDYTGDLEQIKKMVSMRSAKTYDLVLIHENGEECGPIHNVKSWSEQRGLNYHVVHALIRGSCKSYKGWRRKDSI